MLEKTCTKCASTKSVSQFHKSSRGRLGVDSICKVCSKAKTMAYRAAHPGVHAKIQARYREKHPERVKLANEAWRKENGKEYERDRYRRRQSDPAQYAVFRAGQNRAKGRRRNAGELDKAYIKALVKNPCRYCGGPAGQIDHIIPLSRGGSNHNSNLAPSCAQCNQRKGTRTPEEWQVPHGIDR